MRAGPTVRLSLEACHVLDVIFLAGSVMLFAILAAYAGLCAKL